HPCAYTTLFRSALLAAHHLDDGVEGRRRGGEGEDKVQAFASIEAGSRFEPHARRAEIDDPRIDGLLAVRRDASDGLRPDHDIEAHSLAALPRLPGCGASE